MEGGKQRHRRDVKQEPAPSDQAPGEETVPVDDAYTGGGPPPDREPFLDDDQHRTGG
jgi:hypothetical protein